MGGELNPAQRLHALGQSLWLDSINRVMLRTGTLARYVRDLAVTGLTSNPTILGHAMAAGSDYDSSLARLVADGVTDAQDLVYALALEDLAEAAALFRPAWEQTGGADGYVSLEVPPDVAYDAAATVPLARRLHDQAGFPNLLVKSPGTPQGLTAMEEAITAGIGVNVTLFLRHSLPAHRRRLPAGPRAPPPRRPGPGGALGGLGVHLPLGCRRRPAAAARAARQPGAGDGPEDLRLPCAAALGQALAGARRGRRPPAAGPVGIHLDQEPRPAGHLLSGPARRPDTIDTVPEKTLLAFADHGSLDDRLEPDYAAAERAIAATADAGVDADALAEHLQRQGAGAFTADWAALLTAIKEKAAKPTT
ncbi:MAG TPA: transaldolase family protein [Streptosporangiaceae bacterium]|nr:transaldolase family protein [Streptosporangiaceae bacterium]